MLSEGHARVDSLYCLKEGTQIPFDDPRIKFTDRD